MRASRSDAATSTDDIVKGPLCLFYFAHPFGVLSCEPPTVIAPPQPEHEHEPAAAHPAHSAHPAHASASAMARRSPTWPAGACARRLPLYTRTLPPLKLPTPIDLAIDSSSLEGPEDVWPRSIFIPPEKMSLPPLELPPPTPPAASSPRAAAARRVRRPGPVASARVCGVRVRRCGAGARSRGPAALARLLRRAVATGTTLYTFLIAFFVSSINTSMD
ncbi:hypothetical protein O0L34_g10814 [Tuta absoluta]|nr:hypothetical protein O0L34_g10814 [Tuta absoluta]